MKVELKVWIMDLAQEEVRNVLVVFQSNAHLMIFSTHSIRTPSHFRYRKTQRRPRSTVKGGRGGSQRLKDEIALEEIKTQETEQA